MSNSTEAEKQLGIGYGGDSRLGEVLRQPRFFLMVELNPKRAKDGGGYTPEFFKRLQDEEQVFGICVTDGLDGAEREATIRLSDLALSLTGKTVLTCLSGRGQDEASLVDHVGARRAEGFRDFLAVTGEYECGASHYMDSVDILHIGCDFGDDNCMGAVVNPFKYTQEDQCAQYSKMMRKLNNGARFLVAQSGWDMKKYQELIWFLRSRNQLVPLVARIRMFNWKNTKDLKVDLRPGVQLPMKIASEILAERGQADGGTVTEQEFLERQAERAAFLAVGCRLLGYSGIQVCGIETLAELDLFLQAFKSALADYPDYDTWLDKWNGRYENVTMLPFVPDFVSRAPYYLYGALLEHNLRNFDAKYAKPSLDEIKEPSLADRMQSKLAAPDTPQWIRKTVGKWVCASADCQDLSGCFGLDNAACPKHLTLGPCGDSSVNGICCNGKDRCFFQKIIRLAVWNRQMAFLEDTPETDE